METVIMAVLGFFSILSGAVMYKNKIYKGVLVFFYTEALRKQIDIGKQKNKDKAAEVTGMFYIISGCIFALGTLVSILSGLVNYVSAFVVLAVLMMFIITYVRVNFVMTQN